LEIKSDIRFEIIFFWLKRHHFKTEGVCVFLIMQNEISYKYVLSKWLNKVVKHLIKHIHEQEKQKENTTKWLNLKSIG